MSKINMLRDKVNNKDLNRDNPLQMIPLINEIRDVRKAIEQKEQTLHELGKQIKFLKNKHGGIDIEKKFEQLQYRAQDLRENLQLMANDYDVLKELQEEFDGYTSDIQEEDFIDRLGVEIKDIEDKCKLLTAQNDKLIDKVQLQVQDITRSGGQINAAEIEKRAQMYSEIEEEASNIMAVVEECDRKLDRNKSVFMGMSVTDKLNRRA